MPPRSVTNGSVTESTVSAVNQLPKSPPAAGEYRLHNIDVGTGLSVLIQGADFTMLYDGGSMDDKSVIASSGNKDRLLAYLFAAIGPSGPAACTPEGDNWQSVDRPRVTINYLFLSHPHDDHVAMLGDVVRCYDVGQVLRSRRRIQERRLCKLPLLDRQVRSRRVRDELGHSLGTRHRGRKSRCRAPFRGRYSTRTIRRR